VHIIATLLASDHLGRQGAELMASHDRLTLDGVLAGFDEHLRRTRGVCAGTRRNYARFVRMFLQRVFAGGPVDVAKIH
jgi:integrase/recombinase XerD